MALPRTLRWKQWSGEGLEHLHVADTGDDITIRGRCIGEIDGIRYGLSYEMHLGGDWTFRSLQLQDADSDAPGHLVLQRRADGRWLTRSVTAIRPASTAASTSTI